MTRVDLHPDELLDPSRRRALTSDERSRLERHLALCPACAFETAATADFARWLDHAPADEAAAARIADRVMLALKAGPWPVARTIPAPRGRLRRVRPLAVAAVIVAMTAAAGAAAWYLAIVPWLAPQEPAAAPAGGPAARTIAASGDAGFPAESPPAPAQPPRPRAGRATPPPVAVPPPEAAELPAPPVPEASLLPAPIPRVRPSPPRASVESVAAPEPPEAPAPEPTAAELLAQSNELRRAGAYREASERYRELQGRYAGTREALVSRVTLGRLFLERLGDAPGALELFDGYLAVAPEGTLAEEAWVGRALALQRLGRTQDERAAWTTLLSRFPGSAHAERARQRLGELAGAEP